MESEQVFKAIEFAAKAHTGQFRKGTHVPYIIHPVSVGKTLIEAMCREDVVVAGILHDTVEDTETNLADIKNLFGEAVAQLVQAVSEPDKSAPWEERKRHTIDYLGSAPMEVLVIGLADKLDNIQSIYEGFQKTGASFWERFNRPRDSQKWYYESLALIFSRRIETEPYLSLVRQFDKMVRAVFN